MKTQKMLITLSAVVLLVFVVGLAPAPAANTAPLQATAPGAKKFPFTLTELNNAKRAYAAKPQLLLSWQTRVRLANDALARDAATIKTSVDEVLARADKKAVDCSAKDYSLADLQNLCQANEGVQACLDRLRMNCIMGQAGQQAQDSMANAMAALTVQQALDRLKKDITALEQALYK